MTTYIKNTEKTQINNLILYLKLLKNQEQAKPKTSRRREIIKIRDKIYPKQNKTKNQQNKKLILCKNKIEKPLANLMQMRRENTNINKIRNEKGNITTRKSRNHQGQLLRTDIQIN
jgi:hypothetical protein